MLVTFSCNAYADITMFGDVAIRLLKLTGHSGKVPGAFLADDVGEAKDKLLAAIEKEKQKIAQQGVPENADDEPAVTLPQRAQPLIELLQAAQKAECNVMWDSNN